MGGRFDGEAGGLGRRTIGLALRQNGADGRQQDNAGQGQQQRHGRQRQPPVGRAGKVRGHDPHAPDRQKSGGGGGGGGGGIRREAPRHAGRLTGSWQGGYPVE